LVAKQDKANPAITHRVADLIMRHFIDAIHPSTSVSAPTIGSAVDVKIVHRIAGNDDVTKAHCRTHYGASELFSCQLPIDNTLIANIGDAGIKRLTDPFMWARQGASSRSDRHNKHDQRAKHKAVLIGRG